MSRRAYISGMRWCLWRWTLAPTDRIMRLHVIKTPWFAICLHWIFGPDPNEPLHDHPASFLSLMLRGWYTELRGGRLRNRRRLNFIRATDTHKIVDCDPRTLTLALMGPKVREWGFHTPTGWIYWKHYRQTPHE